MNPEKENFFKNFRPAPVDSVAVEQRVQRFCSRSIKKESKLKALYLILNMIDLTTLEGKDTTGKIRQLCSKALHLCDEFPDLPTVAAVCVYPNHVREARYYLKNSPVKVASVSTSFPSGNAPFQVKMDDTRFALDEGADEIDMVISRGEFLKGNYSYVYDEIAGIKELCNNYGARLKVILETGELSTLENVRKASDIAIAAGADFIKTSTGKIQPAATMPVTLVMLYAIRDHFLKTGKMVGMKPAGGISSAKNAIQYLIMLYETLGPAWMNNNWFRFGASSLANDVLMQIGKEIKGVYYGKNYISID